MEKPHTAGKLQNIKSHVCDKASDQPLPGSLLRKLYFALDHPHLNYGILSWGNAGQLLRKTITLQKRAIRSINKAIIATPTHYFVLLKS